MVSGTVGDKDISKPWSRTYQVMCSRPSGSSTVT